MKRMPVVLSVFLVALAPAGASAEAPRKGLEEAMTAFTATLDEEQSRSARYAFDDDERFDLRLAPLGLEGLTLKEMTAAQRKGLHHALASVLSEQGMRKVDTIRSLEKEVAETESGWISWFMDDLRDPLRYFLALFGDPGTDEAWGMRFDGHHLSLNWTSVPGAPLSVTPLFLGGQPREVPAGLERAGLRVLAGEEDLGVALVRALSDAEREEARLRFRRGGAIRRPMFVGEGEELELLEPAGVSTTALSPAALSALDALIEVHLANFASPIAARHRERIAAQRSSIHFAYAQGGPDADARPPQAGDPFYYRIHGADFLIEFDDTSSAADHVHVVFRERAGDFGRDLLADHYGDGHAH